MFDLRIEEAKWSNEQEFVVFFNRDIDSAVAQNIKIFKGSEELEVIFSEIDRIQYAKSSGYFERDGSIHFLLTEDCAVDTNSSLFFVVGDFNHWDKQNEDARIVLKPQLIDGEMYYYGKILRKKLPENFQFKFISINNVWANLPAFSANVTSPVPGILNFEYYQHKSGAHCLKYRLKKRKFQFGDKPFFVKFNGISILIDDVDLVAALYPKQRLGSWIDGTTTYFALFAPRASSVSVIFGKNFRNLDKKLAMERSQEGVWSATTLEDLSGFYYYFELEKFNENGKLEIENVVDPYAKAVVNREGPGIIVKDVYVDKYFHAPREENLIILECHVRDVLAEFGNIDSEEKLGFSGLKKMLDDPENYFSKLGINAVELQPIQEFDNKTLQEYHWGYMPVNYFSPASAYASNSSAATQIEEFRALVQKFHELNIAVIVDVVYNHVGEPNFLFNIDKKYYFRWSKDGSLQNFSGCGNDLKTEQNMVRRLIYDSLEHFIKVYDIDGFRFDLAELVGLQFIDEIRIELKKIKPSLLMIVEPWSFRRYAGHDVRETGLLGWNDEYRNFIRSYVMGENNADALEYFLWGSLKFRSNFPAQSINYLSSHDDFCWIDSVTENANHNGTLPTVNDVRRTHIALAILLLSLGVPMLSEGVDFFHSKRGCHNSYQSGELNALDFSRMLEFSVTHDWVSRLIDLRKKIPLFCLKNRPANGYIRRFNSGEKSSAAVFLFNANFENGDQQILLAINPHLREVSFDLSSLKNQAFVQIADTYKFGNLTTFYPWNNDVLVLPKMSCGIWKLRC